MGGGCFKIHPSNTITTTTIDSLDVGEDDYSELIFYRLRSQQRYCNYLCLSTARYRSVQLWTRSYLFVFLKSDLLYIKQCYLKEPDY